MYLAEGCCIYGVEAVETFAWQRIIAAKQLKVKLFCNLNRIYRCNENVSVQYNCFTFLPDPLKTVYFTVEIINCLKPYHIEFMYNSFAHARLLFLGEDPS